MKFYKPTTPSRRGMTRPDFSMITKKGPEKKLLSSLKSTGGRNNKGRISVRFRGGGAKRMYRVVDFGEKHLGETAKVVGIEYDPNRTARIALVEYENKERAYVVSPDGLKAGEAIEYSESGEIKSGNRIKLKNIPVGTFVYNVEINPMQGGKIARSAGTGVKVLAIEGGYATLTMPSGEVRKVLAECFATIGFVSNTQHNLGVIGKAGRKRHMGKRPHVRGTAMNPVDHPHGGGEGRAPVGLKYPKTPWGKIAYGVRTRSKKKYSTKFIMQRRKNKKRK